MLFWNKSVIHIGPYSMIFGRISGFNKPKHRIVAFLTTNFEFIYPFNLCTLRFQSLKDFFLLLRSKMNGYIPYIKKLHCCSSVAQSPFSSHFFHSSERVLSSERQSLLTSAQDPRIMDKPEDKDHLGLAFFNAWSWN